MTPDLQPLIAPKSISIYGASADANKLNGRPLAFLRRDGFAGEIYPINPKYQDIDGLPCYADAASVPGPIDLAVITVPAHIVPAAMRDLGTARAKTAVIFSSGFAEMGPEGAALQDEVAQAARAHGLRFCGPNTLGLINAFDNVAATFSQYAMAPPVAGPVGFVTQSGAFGTAIAGMAREQDLGIGLFVNTGNEADLTVPDILPAVLSDPRIAVCCAYFEAKRDHQTLAELASRSRALGKPLVLAKVGRSPAGVGASRRHTASDAGDDADFQRSIDDLGLIRARNEEHMLDLAAALTASPPAEGRGIGIVTQSGGAGVLMADRAAELGLAVPELGVKTRQRLAKVLPAFGVTHNPVDITGQFLAEPTILSDSIRAVLDDPGVAVGIVWFQMMHGYADTVVEILAEANAASDKPLLVVWVAGPGDGIATLRQKGLPVYPASERAVDAAAGLVRFGAFLRRDE